VSLPCWEGSAPNVHNSPDCTPTPLLTSGGAGPSNPNSELPAMQNPGQGSSPSNLPVPLGMIIALLLIGLCFIGGLIFLIRRKPAGSFGDGSIKNSGPGDQFLKFEDPTNQFLKLEGSDKMEAQPHMDNGPVQPGSTDESLSFEQPGSATEMPPGPPI